MQDLNPKVSWSIFIVFVVLVLGVTGYFAYKFYKDNNNLPEPVVVNVPVEKPEVTEPAAKPEIKHVSDPGVKWLAEPQKIGNLGYVKEKGDENGYADLSEITYYKIADLDAGGEIILAKAQFETMGGREVLRFKKNSDGKIYFLLKNSSLSEYSYASKLVVNSVNIDDSTSYQSITPPDYLKADGANLKKASYSSLPDIATFFKDLKNPKEIIETEYGFIYKTKDKEDAAEVGSVVYNLRLIDTTLAQYSFKYDFMTDDEIALVTWKDGTKNSAKFTPEGYIGCGSVAKENIIINTENIESRLLDAGKTNAGDSIYSVSKDDPAMKAAYENYKIGRDKDILPISEFAQKHPIFIWKNKFGDYVIFTGRDFAGLAECGKPVIYLYPEKPTQVSVKVGADITKSEPTYQNGWKTFAEPSGKLIVDGKTYDYLFWEGLGKGYYPIFNQGFVIEKKNIESTLKEHLAKLGLNSKESADFMEFWLSKMPNTPYVRLTWFGTREMNQLAPLDIQPKPDTMIRIFLDFEGLEKPINIPPQKLSTIPRKGFTLIEWGGLLREK